MQSEKLSVFDEVKEISDYKPLDLDDDEMKKIKQKLLGNLKQEEMTIDFVWEALIGQNLNGEKGVAVRLVNNLLTDLNPELTKQEIAKLIKSIDKNRMEQ